MQTWHKYIANLQRRFDDDMSGTILINGVFASVTNPASLTKIFAQDVPHAGLVVTGNCDHAIYRITREDGVSPTQYWAALRDVEADYLAKKITTGEAREWYPEKYKTVFREKFAHCDEHWVQTYVEGIDCHEDAAACWGRWPPNCDSSPWDMGLAPSMKVYMHAAALRAIGREAYRQLEVRERCAKPS